MNPFLSNELAGERIRDLREEAARASRGRDRSSSVKGHRIPGLTIRRFAERDIDAVRRLATLDEKPLPSGGVLVAELDGELVAALALEGGQALADPFKPTANIVELLRLRARQLAAASDSPRAPLWTSARARLRAAA